MKIEITTSRDEQKTFSGSELLDGYIYKIANSQYSTLYIVTGSLLVWFEQGRMGTYSKLMFPERKYVVAPAGTEILIKQGL